MPANTIEEVIVRLDALIDEGLLTESRIGLFAALSLVAAKASWSASGVSMVGVVGMVELLWWGDGRDCRAAWRGDSSADERGERRGAAVRARRPRGFCC